MSDLRSHHLCTLLLLLSLSCSLLTACDRDAPTTETPSQESAAIDAPPALSRQDYGRTNTALDEPQPPTPPISENFEGQPQLSLFPRIGDVRPEESTEELRFWNSFIDHLNRTSGIAADNRPESKRCWSLRSIGDLESVAFFAPVAVKPSTRYRVSAQLKTDLPEGASAGLGIIEFREFLWIGDQFTSAQMQEYQVRTSEGVRLTGRNDWTEASFDIETAPEAHMIHLLLFREGAKGREPVFFDDIAIAPLPSSK
jgi:hypothetical protein